MKKIIKFSLVLILSVLLSSCSKPPIKRDFNYFDSFDTITKAIGYFKDENAAKDFDKALHAKLIYYNNLFDCHKEYKNLNNVYTINKYSGEKAVKVDKALIDLIERYKDLGLKYDSKVNIAMGPVIELWDEKLKEYSEGDPNKSVSLPDMAQMKKRSLNTDLNNVIIDRKNSSIFLKNKGMKLNLGAVAKGYAVELISLELKDMGYNSFLISAGGNVKSVGSPYNKNKWTVGIENPFYKDGSEKMNEIYDIIYIKDKSIVTSGDYQRYFISNGVKYNHILDPDTLSSARNYRAVTVICKNSGDADFYSTLLFILPYEKASEVLKSLDDVDAIFINSDNTEFHTDGMKKYLKTLGAEPN